MVAESVSVVMEGEVFHNKIYGVKVELFEDVASFACVTTSVPAVVQWIIRKTRRSVSLIHKLSDDGWEKPMWLVLLS